MGVIMDGDKNSVMDQCREKMCADLDDLLIRVMEQYDILQQCYAEMASLLKEGHINIAQARHHKGFNTICTLQYPESMTPMITTKRTSTGAKAEYVLISEEDGDSLDKATGNTTDKAKDNETALTQRKNKNTPQRSSTDNASESGDTHTDEKSIDAQEDKENEPKHPPTTQSQSDVNKSGVNKSGVNKADPIRWFGLLVPAPLRTAQKDFRTAVELSLTMVGLKNGIVYDIKQIETLKVALKASDEGNGNQPQHSTSADGE